MHFHYCKEFLTNIVKINDRPGLKAREKNAKIICYRKKTTQSVAAKWIIASLYFGHFFADLQGYSFVSPSVIFANNNVIGEECLAEDFQALVSVSPFFSKYKLDRTEAGLLGRGSFSICRWQLFSFFDYFCFNNFCEEEIN